MSERLGWYGAWALLGILLVILAITLPELGSDPWPFRPTVVDPQGVLAPLVRAAGRDWDVGIARTGCFIAALICGGGAVALFWMRSWPAWAGAGLVLLVALILLVPSTFLQLGLRQSTAPWFFTNDSTYQVELGGRALLKGHDPYGRDYRHTGLERFYTYDGSVSPSVLKNQVALRHFAYFPGTVLTAALWRGLPKPFDDYRFFLLVCTVLTLFAALAFRAPLAWRLGIGALLVCNPIAVRSSWFGQTDAPSLLLLVLAFAMVTRTRYGWAAASLAGAVLLKQFALVALPFIALMLLKRGATRAELRRAGLIFVGILAIAILPFFLWDPGAFWADTVRYGAGTYKIVGYGLSDILLRFHIIDSRTGSYPFVLFAVVLWLPLTVWLLFAQRKAPELWVGAAAFAVSILVLMWIGRTFNNYYLVWPLTGAAIAALMAAGERATPASRP